MGGDNQYIGGFTEAGTCGLMRLSSSDAVGQVDVEHCEDEEGRRVYGSPQSVQDVETLLEMLLFLARDMS